MQRNNDALLKKLIEEHELNCFTKSKKFIVDNPLALSIDDLSFIKTSKNYPKKVILETENTPPETFKLFNVTLYLSLNILTFLTTSALMSLFGIVFRFSLYFTFNSFKLSVILRFDCSIVFN